MKLLYCEIINGDSTAHFNKLIECLMRVQCRNVDGAKMLSPATTVFKNK